MLERNVESEVAELLESTFDVTRNTIKSDSRDSSSLELQAEILKTSDVIARAI